MDFPTLFGLAASILGLIGLIYGFLDYIRSKHPPKEAQRVMMALSLVAVIVGGIYGLSQLSHSLALPFFNGSSSHQHTALSMYDTAITAQGVMFGFDAQHTNYNPYEDIISSAAVSSLVQDWTAPTADQIIGSVPAVVNGVVYVGSSDRNLYAFDAISGKTRWKTSIGGIIGSSPAVVNGVVYIGSQDGNLYALDAKSGAICWATTLARVIDDNSPTVVNGVIYIGSDDGRLYALDAQSGAIRWATTTEAVDSSPAVVDGVVYIGTYQGKVYAIDARSGAIRWRTAIGSIIETAPTVTDGVVYISSWDSTSIGGKVTNAKLSALDTASGKTRWTYITENDPFSSSAVADGILYVGSSLGKVYAFDIKSGTPRWVVTVNSSIIFGIQYAPTVAHGVVYIGTDYDLYALDAKTGKILWHHFMGYCAVCTLDSVSSSVVVANGMIYVDSRDHHLYAFHLSNTKQ